MSARKPTDRKRLASLVELARIASTMMDGDVADRIITERALHHVLNPDPEYRFLAGDYYDVDHAAFLITKKSMMRLSRLIDFECGVTLWLRVRGSDSLVTPAVRQGELSRWCSFSTAFVDAPPPLADVLATGTRVAIEPEPDARIVTALSIVLDSLSEPVGVIELSALSSGFRGPAPISN